MDVILSGLSLLHEPDEIIEIRSIDPKPVISGYFRADSPAIAKELSRYAASYMKKHKRTHPPIEQVVDPLKEMLPGRKKDRVRDKGMQR